MRLVRAWRVTPVHRGFPAEQWPEVHLPGQPGEVIEKEANALTTA